MYEIFESILQNYSCHLTLSRLRLALSELVGKGETHVSGSYDEGGLNIEWFSVYIERKNWMRQLNSFPKCKCIE